MADQIGLGQGRRQPERPRQAGLGRNLDQQIFDRPGADDVEHRALVLRRVWQISPQCPPWARNSSYFLAVSSWSHSAAFQGLMTIIQPRPLGPWLTSSGVLPSSAFTSTTIPCT